LDGASGAPPAIECLHWLPPSSRPSAKRRERRNDLKRQVAVRFFGVLGRLAGRQEASVEVDEGATLLDLLSLLAETAGPDFRGAVFRAPNEAQTNLRVFLNQEEAALTDRVLPGNASPAQVDLLALTAFEGGGL